MSDTISTIDNRLRGKSVIVAIYRRYIGIGQIYQQNFDCRTHVWGRNLFAQIIGNILRISLIYRWLKNGLVDSFDGLDYPANDPMVQISPEFSNLSMASLTDLTTRFEFVFIQRPRFHPNLRCYPTVRFFIQRPDLKS